jgi:hypothetical protein
MLRTRRRSLGELGDELVERYRVVNQVVAQRVQLQRLVVDDARARLEREDVLARRLGVHRDEEVDFLPAGDVAVTAGPNRVPRGQAGDVRREEVFPGHRHAHLEDRAQENEVRRLASRAVDGGHLDAEVVDDPPRRRGSRTRLRLEIDRSHQ